MVLEDMLGIVKYNLQLLQCINKNYRNNSYHYYDVHKGHDTFVGYLYKKTSSGRLATIR